MKCSSCGKIFDYEKYYGICPKCGTYNKPKQEDDINKQAMNDAWNNEANEQSVKTDWENDPYQWNANDKWGKQKTNEYAGNVSDAQIYGETRTKLTKNEEQQIKKHMIVCIALTIVFVVVGIVVIIMIPKCGKRAYQSEASKQTVELFEEPVNPKKISQGDVITVEDETNITLCPKMVEIVEPIKGMEEIPEGKKLVRVYLEGTASKVDYDYDSKYVDSIGQIYAGYAGVYTASISEYHLVNDDSEEGEKLDLEVFWGYGLKNYDQQGYVYFLLPEDVTSFEMYVETRNYQTNELYQVYEIPYDLAKDITEGEEIEE